MMGDKSRSITIASATSAHSIRMHEIVANRSSNFRVGSAILLETIILRRFHNCRCRNTFAVRLPMTRAVSGVVGAPPPPPNKHSARPKRVACAPAEGWKDWRTGRRSPCPHLLIVLAAFNTKVVTRFPFQP